MQGTLLERLLLTNRKFTRESVPQDTIFDPSIIDLCEALLNEGQYEAVMKQLLQSEAFHSLFMQHTLDVDDLPQYYDGVERGVHELWQAQENQWRVLLFGICALQIFVQANFTGPSPTSAKEGDLPVVLCLPVKGSHGEEEELNQDQRHALQKYAVSALSISGEVVYAKIELPHYLLMARIFLTQPMHSEIELETYDWWTARYCNVHQQILSHAVQTLFQTSCEAFDRLRDRFSVAENVADDEIASRFHLEEGLMFHSISDNKRSKRCFQLAKEATGLQVQLTGVMGTRTKYQSEKKAQLVVKATSRASEAGQQADEKQQVPATVPLEEKTELLEKTKTDDDDDDDENVKNLRIIDQAIVLSLCLDVKNNNPDHGLTQEEMMPYVIRTLENANNWLVHTMGLLLKSRLEKDRSRTAERAALQLQVLVEQYDDETPDVTERMRFFYDIAFPPMFELKRELGLRMMSVGAVRSALEWFEKLEMWEEIIQCHIVMENENRAQRVVEERLQVEPTNPMLLCLYGDITKNPQHYGKAWEVSGKRFARAKRSLGSYYFNRKELKTSIEHYKDALEFSQLYPHSWFILGVAAMKVQEWDTALSAFTQVVQQEPEDGESWCNMAAVYLYQKEYRKAFGALQEGLKHKYLNWKIWENYLFVAMNLQEYKSAIYAVNRLLQLREEKEVNTEVLLALVKAMHIMLKKDPMSGNAMKERLAEMFQRVTSKISLNPDVWDAYAVYYEALGDTDRVIDMRQKHVRTVQVSGWDREPSKFKCVVTAVDYLVEAQMDAATETFDVKRKKYYYSSALMLLKPIIKRTQDVFKGTEAHEKLKQLAERVQQTMNTLAAMQQ